MSGFESIVDIWPLLVVGLALTGVVAGILAGLLGVGGGIVVVPVLFWMFTFLDFLPAIAMHVAVATSLLNIIPTSISSMRAHYQRGTVDVDIVKRWGITMGVAALIGGLVARYVDASVLQAIFGVIGILISINIWVASKRVIAQQLPQSNTIQQSIAGAIGFLSSWMGIGGGTFTVSTLTLCNYPVHKAVGTSAALGLFIALPGTIGFMISGMSVENLPPFSLGYVNLLAAAIIFPLSVLLAPVGAKLAHSINPKGLKRVFAIFLALTALRMLVDLW